jgi:hypothetical protein
VVEGDDGGDEEEEEGDTRLEHEVVGLGGDVKSDERLAREGSENAGAENNCPGDRGSRLSMVTGAQMGDGELMGAEVRPDAREVDRGVNT